MNNVIPFPGIDPAKIRPRPTCMADLPTGARALAVVPERSGFVVEIRPAVTAAEKLLRRFFLDAREARQFARRIAAGRPRHFQLIIDEAGADSLEALLGPGPDPMGLGTEI